ncbi:MAG: hypothetical protein U0640_10375 [Phycisphaerales bacterium]
MIWFGLGGCFIYTATLVASYFLRREDLFNLSTSAYAQFLLGVVVLPVLVQVLVAEATAKLLRKRIFDIRLQTRFTPLVLGTLVAILSVATTAAILPFVGDLRFEIALLAAPAALYSFLFIAFSPKVRQGVCLYCNYTLATSMHRCPECGKFNSPTSNTNTPPQEPLPATTTAGLVQ